MPIINASGFQLDVRVNGHGSSVICLLPQSAGPRTVQPFLENIASQHQVITYDQRGTGRSGPAPEHWSMDSLAIEVVSILDALHLDNTALFCHSTGCGIGLSVIDAVGGRVGALILSNPWTHADSHLHTMQTLRKAASRALDPQQYAHFNHALLFPPEYRREHATAFSELAGNANNAPQNADEISRRLDAILAFDARKYWHRVCCPTLIVCAKDDQLMPPWHAIETAGAIAQAELVVMDYGGHMLAETRHDRLTERVLDFLARSREG